MKPVLILLLATTARIHSSEEPCRRDQMLCTDKYDNTVCVNRASACAFPEVQCAHNPDLGPPPGALLWPKSVMESSEQNFDLNTNNSNAETDVTDAIVSSSCLFPSYVKGFGAWIFNRETRTWPGEPHPIPFRPFGLVHLSVICGDFNNSDHDNNGYTDSVKDGSEKRTSHLLGEIFKLNEVEGGKFYKIYEPKSCAKGAVKSMSAQYWDAEKAWSKAYGIRYFSEGITDISADCVSEDENVTTSNISKFGETRRDEFWSWSNKTKCGQGKLMCNIHLTINALVGGYRLGFYCCPMNRTHVKPDVAPKHYTQAPTSSEAPNIVPPPEASCPCKNQQQGVWVKPRDSNTDKDPVPQQQFAFDFEQQESTTPDKSFWLYV